MNENYQKILDRRSEAVEGKFPPPSTHLFTGGDVVQHNFVEVTDELIVHSYTDKRNGNRAYYKVYPLKKGELEGLLQDAGFSTEVIRAIVDIQ